MDEKSGIPEQQGLQPSYPAQPGPSPSNQTPPNVYQIPPPVNMAPDKQQMAQPAPCLNPGALTQPQPYPYPAQPPAYTNAPPLPPGYAPQQYYLPGQPGVTIINGLQLGRSPVTCTCPSCHQVITTQTELQVGVLIWMIFLMIILFGGWILCLCFIPFCMEDLKEVKHSCPNCKHLIGVYKRNM